MDLCAQVATLSRVTALMNDQGAEASGTERFIAETYCTRAARRVERNLDLVESNDDERMGSIYKVATRRGGSGFELYDVAAGTRTPRPHAGPARTRRSTLHRVDHSDHSVWNHTRVSLHRVDHRCGTTPVSALHISTGLSTGGGCCGACRLVWSTTRTP
jgi:hypothetical protein